MSKRKSNNNNNFTKVTSFVVIVAFTFSIGYVFFGIGKSFGKGDFNINSDINLVVLSIHLLIMFILHQ